MRRVSWRPAAATLALLASLGGCVGLPPLDPGRVAALPPQVLLAAVPFHPDTGEACGPAALATALGAAGFDATPEALAPQLRMPARPGSLPADLAGAARRSGAVALRVEPGLEALLEALAEGTPVVVLQNLSLPWMPLWHYAVAVGYDRRRGVLWLRSGPLREEVIPLGTFDRTWARSGRWGLRVLAPDRPPRSAGETAWAGAAAALESAGQPAAARRAYTAGLERWPRSLPMALGAGNAAWGAGDAAGAEQALRRALALHPDAVPVLNNLAHVLAARGALAEAETLALEAAARPGPHQAAALDTLTRIRGQRAP